MSPRPVPTPSRDQVREAFAKTGATLRAAPLLAINYRTLERRMAADPALKTAADAGRRSYAATIKPAPHGTINRYDWELRHHIPTCDDCRAANAAEATRRRAKAVAA